MNDNKPKITYLKDYTPSDFLINSVFLHFELNEDVTHVKSILSIRRNPLKNNQHPLILDGEELKLKSILLDAVPLTPDRYQVDEKHLTIPHVPDLFLLEIEVEIKPQENTRLSGLYKSNNIFCTQCESHGFRRITYYLDRPDALSHFTTTISADKDRYPVLLANGNLVDQKELAHNRHWVKWEDPTLKPCYLFALIAGKLDVIEDHFVTQSGRTVKLAVYVEQGKKDQAQYAMQSLKQAMHWDEQVYGREYELDRYMIVAVGDFNFGAMENKGLNIFNDKYILAKPETATDEDFVNIQAVVGHEYFHNWSGNRVTVRDWFQITLKEGLTVLREQDFTADMTSKAVKRIHDAKVIRNTQFAQDASPMAHPIAPSSYIETNNFYTVTVYSKGAEVIRMMKTLLGPTLFRKAMDLYFSRNDGHAVTTEDFIKAMEDASGIDLKQFRRWYAQAGTPVLTVKDHYNPQQQTYSLTITQFTPPTPGQAEKQDLHIPLAMGLIDSVSGKELPLQLQGETAPSDSTTRVLNLKNHAETFYFIHVAHKPIPSLLRDFSAPVKLNYDYKDDDLLFLMLHDGDSFNRWDAGQQLAVRLIFRLIKDYQQNRPLQIDGHFIRTLEKVLTDPQLEEALIAEMLTLPSEKYLIELMDIADVTAIHEAREFVKKTIASQLKKTLMDSYQKYNAIKKYELSAKAMGQRRLKNLCLRYLAQLEEPDIYRLSLQQFQQANNMTDVMGALTALNDIDCKERTQAMAEFYQRWQKDSLVVDKWFTIQAQSTLPNTLQTVKELIQHPAFDIKNPNRARALIGAFSVGNPTIFHNPNGEAYVFLTDQVLKVNSFNPQLAARLVEPLIHWRKFDELHQHLMKQQLERIAAAPKLSNDLYEIVTKSLKAHEE